MPLSIALVVPPLAHLTWPTLGVHLLQGVARAEGHQARVLYLGARLAARIGSVTYARLANASTDWLIGERLLAWKAFGHTSPERAFDDLAPALAEHNATIDSLAEEYLDHLSDGTGHRPSAWGYRYQVSELVNFARVAGEVVDELAVEIVRSGVDLLGATTSFDQTSASIALLAQVRRLDPSIRTVVGGANCEGPMGAAVAELSPAIDHVFSGESEQVFADFLTAVQAGDDPPRLISGRPCEDMDALPRPDFADYFQEIGRYTPELIEEGRIWLSYETSRGCWWGEKQHCTFCGLNGLGMAYRAKSPDTVIRDLRALLERAPAPYIALTDNILPHRFHRTLVPRLADEVGPMHAFYEVKANLTLDQVAALSRAGIKAVQPGIESLSTPVLRLMRKGVLARQNLALLRYGAITDVLIKWNLLYAFPGDRAEHYAEMAALLPAMHHLTPPNGLVHLSLDRFSPYFDHADQHGISDIEPLPAYAKVFPPHANVRALAYHFAARWPSGILDAPQVLADLWRKVQDWRAAWATDPAPVLRVTPQGPGRWLLVDTRGGHPRSMLLTDAQARAALVGGPVDRVPTAAWAFRHRVAVPLDGWCAPLATAPLSVLVDAEARWGRVADQTRLESPVEHIRG